MSVFILALAAACLLFYAAMHDLAARTVPNWLPLALLGIGFALRLLDHTLPAALLVTAGTFTVLFGAWIAGAMGGGDVKLWAAAALLVPPSLARELHFFLWVLIGGGALAVFYLGLAPVVARPRAARGGGLLMRVLRAEAWRIGRRAPLPYACAIAAGAVASLPLSFEVR